MAEVIVDRLRVLQRDLLHFFSGGTSPKFEGGGELAGLCRAEARLLLELSEVERLEFREGSGLLDKRAPDLDRGLALDSGAEQDGEKFGAAERSGTEAK